MSVLDTRFQPDGTIRRRRQFPDGTIVVTIEVPQAVLFAQGRTAVTQALAAWKRGHDRRAAARALRTEVLARAGWKATAVAHDLGCTEARVRQIRSC